MKYLSCDYPFTGMDITLTGNVYMCCADWMPIPIGNILETPLMEIWQGKIATKIRISILDRSFRFCRPSCPFLSNPRGPVKKVQKTHSPPPLNPIGELRLSYDPTCNLKCPSCRKTAMGSDETTRQIHEKIAHPKTLSHVSRLYLSGYGDPIASPHYWGLLCRLDTLPTPHNLTVRLHTNGLLLTPEKWKELGKNSNRILSITVSVDAARETTYQLNRGGDWRQLQENLNFISSLPNVRLEMNFVVQANNFKEMPDFARMAFSHSAQFVFFAGIRNWDAAYQNESNRLPSSPINLRTVFSDLDYQQKAVHRPSHPQHKQLLGILQDPIFRDPRILLGDFLS